MTARVSVSTATDSHTETPTHEGIPLAKLVLFRIPVQHACRNELQCGCRSDGR